MANNKTNIIDLLKNLEFTLGEVNRTGVNDEESLKKILKDFCMKFNNDVTDTNELEKLSNSINKILGEIVRKYSKISEDTKTQAASAEDPKTQAASAEISSSTIEGKSMPMVIGQNIPQGIKLGGKKRKTKNKKTKKHKKRRTKKLKKKKSKKYRKVNTKKH